MTASEEGGQSDDVIHLGRFVQDASGWPESEYIRTVYSLLGFATYYKTEFPVSITFANELGGTVALARTGMQMRAAYILAAHGFNAEVRNLLRSAYESAGLARVIAKDGQIAERWLKEGHYFPDSAVRRWIRKIRNDPQSTVEGFKDFYENYSAWAHPTATSCLPLVKVDNDRLILDPSVSYDSTRSRTVLMEIAIVGLFACFAWRNAFVDETILPTAWRRDLYDLARKMSGDYMPHLERDWQDEESRHQKFLENIKNASEMDETLRNDPGSWHNLRPRA